jgi:predicted permease
VWGAFALTDWLRRFEPPFSVPLVFDVAPRPGALAVAVVIALGAGLAVGLLPTRQLWRQRAGAAAALGGGTRGSAAAGVSRALRLVVALEVALALVLLVAAALFARSLGGARAIDPGFAMEGRWAFRVGPVAAGLEAGRRSAWFGGLVERLAATPGIDAAAQTTRLPLGLGSTTTRAGFTVAGGEPVSLEVDVQTIDAGYLPALAIPLVAGRNLEARDGEVASQPVALVNETLARRLIGGSERPVADALGGVVASDGVERVVVGVARDSKVRRVWEEPRPLLELPAGPSAAGPRTIVVASRLDRGAIADLVAREVRAFDPAVPRPLVLSLAERAAISLLPQRLAGAIAAALGAVCLAVAAAGLFGVVAFWVAARTQEIGIRRALGATDGALRRLVLRQCLHQLALGAGLGLPLAAGAGFLLRGLLVGVGPFDPLALAAASSVLAAAGLLAAWSPLRRALRVDPAGALRGEGG